jgi:hypothetical protein
MRFAFILEEKAHFPVRCMCTVLEVTRSGFYAWCARPVAQRTQDTQRLAVEVAAIHAASKRRYGSPRVHQELQAQGRTVGRHRVARLMQQQGLRARRKRRFQTTTDSRHGLPVAANILDRQFTVPAPNLAWVTDITYLWTREGWLYLAVILDLFSRRVVGWSMSEHITRQLTLDALAAALGQRAPRPGLLHHSDRGSQGGFNRSSQHLEREVFYGTTLWVDGDVDGAAGDAVAGPTAGAARCGAGVLDEDRRGAVERGGGDRVWHVRPSRRALVSRAGGHAIDPAYSAVGSVPVLR